MKKYLITGEGNFIIRAVIEAKSSEEAKHLLARAFVSGVYPDKIICEQDNIEYIHDETEYFEDIKNYETNFKDIDENTFEYYDEDGVHIIDKHKDLFHFGEE